MEWRDWGVPSRATYGAAGIASTRHARDCWGAWVNPVPVTPPGKSRYMPSDFLASLKPSGSYHFGAGSLGVPVSAGVTAVAQVAAQTWRFVAAWKEKAGGELDLTSHCAALALDIIGKVAFSHDFQAVTSVEQWAKGAVRQVELNDPLIKSLYTSMMPSMLRMLFVNLRLGALERFYLRESFNAQVILDREFATVVDRSYARYIRRDKASTESKCLLDYLFDAQTASRAGSTSNSLTHKELQGEMKTLIFAGTNMFDVYRLRKNMLHSHPVFLYSKDTKQQQLFASGQYLV